MPENLAPRDASTDLVFDCRLKGLCAKVSSDPRELVGIWPSALAYSLDSSHSIDLLNEQLAPIQDSNRATGIRCALFRYSHVEDGPLLGRVFNKDPEIDEWARR
jgi:hypothetical protein